MAYQSLILLVCSANICRSPMAEHLLRRRIIEAGDQQRLRVRSAGTWCEPGQSAALHGQTLLLQEGLDLSEHKSHMLNQADVDEADLILVMTATQRREIALRFLRAEAKTYLLSEMVRKSYDIADPYGGTLEDYRTCKDRIEEILDKGYTRIVALAKHVEHGEARRQRGWLGRLFKGRARD